MFCQNCGNENPDGAAFCSGCGTKLVADASGQPHVSPEGSEVTLQVEQGSNNNPTSDRSRSKLPIILISLLLVAAAALFALNHFNIIGNDDPFLEDRQEQPEVNPEQEESDNSSTIDDAEESDGTSIIDDAEEADGTSTIDNAEEADDTSTIDDAEESSVQDSTTAPIPSESESSATDEEQPMNSQDVNPQDAITLTDLELSVDEGGRYVITGKLTNDGNMEYSPRVELTAIKHDKDKYGEETTKETTSFRLKSATGTVGCTDNTLTMWQVQPNETREFTVYPEEWRSSSITYSDVQGAVTEVTMPASVLSRLGCLVDTGEQFEISTLDYSASGVVSGTITNNTGVYISEAAISFVMLDASGKPVPSSTTGTRPSGVTIASATVSALKPGDTAQFEKRIGEGYSSAKFLDVCYVPDESKNNLS